MRVLIADDHPAIRNGIKSLVASAYPGVEFGETGNGRDVIRQLQESGWTMLLLDVDMPGFSGYDILENMRSQCLEVPVLVFSFHKEEQIITRAFELGAAAYVTKDAGGQLLPAIRRILAGERKIAFSGTSDYRDRSW